MSTIENLKTNVLFDYMNHLISDPNYFDKSLKYPTIVTCCGCDRMVVGFTTTCAISGYHH